MLVQLAQHYTTIAEELTSVRPLLKHAHSGEEASVDDELEKEQKRERESDRQCWSPFFQEFEALRSHGYESEEDL